MPHLRPIAVLAAMIASSTLVALVGCNASRPASPGARPAAPRVAAARPALPASRSRVAEGTATFLPVGTQVPALPLTSLDDRADALVNYRGLPVLLAFFATWCPDCREEMPVLEDVHLTFVNDGLKLLAVNASKEPLLAMREFAAVNGYTLPMFGQFTGAPARDWKCNSIPTLYWIGRDGVIQDVAVDVLPPAEVHRRTKALILSQQ